MNYLAILFLFLSFSVQAQVGLQEVMSLLSAKELPGPLTDIYKCYSTEGLESVKKKFCEDTRVHESHPYGILRKKLDSEIKQYMKSLGDRPLDKKYLLWRETMLAACKLEASEPEDLRVQWKHSYRKTILNKPDLSKSDKALLFAHNAVFELEQEFGQFIFATEPNALSELKSKAADLPGSGFLDEAKALSKRKLALQAELLPQVPSTDCEITDGDCKIISNFPNVWDHVPDGSYLSFEDGEAVITASPKLAFLNVLEPLDNKQTFLPIKHLALSWNADESQVVKFKVNDFTKKPFSIHELIKKGVVDQQQINQYRLALKNRRERKLAAELEVLKMIRNPLNLFRIKQLTDDIETLEMKMESELARKKAILSKMYGPSSISLKSKWSECSEREKRLDESYARSQILHAIYYSPDSIKRRDNLIIEAKSMVSASIDSMQISAVGRAKLKDRLAAVKFDSGTGDLVTPQKLSVFFDEFQKIKDQVSRLNLMNENDMSLALAKNFDVGKLGTNGWAPFEKINAHYNPNHSLTVLAPFLLPEASGDMKLSILHVLAHELGHGLDEREPCLSCKKFSLPQDDALKISQLDLCSTKSKVKEDFADIIANESLGHYLKAHGDKLTTVQKTVLANGLFSSLCSPNFSLIDSHSTDSERGEKILTHPLFKEFFEELGIQNTPHTSEKKCEDRLWQR